MNIFLLSTNFILALMFQELPSNGTVINFDCEFLLIFSTLAKIVFDSENDHFY